MKAPDGTVLCGVLGSGYRFEHDWGEYEYFSMLWNKRIYKERVCRDCGSKFGKFLNPGEKPEINPKKLYKKESLRHT